MKINKFGLPTYEFLIDDSIESGVKCISIVADPAFGSKAIFFAEHKPVFIALGDVKKQIVAGLSLIPNVLVYRIDAETQEAYNGFFSAETIEKIVNKFHDEQQGKNVNLNHDSNAKVNAYLLEDFIVNSPERVADLKAKGIEHPNIMGAWYTSYKIKDPKVFEAILNGGDSVGFSVETYLEKVLAEFNQEIKDKIITKIKTVEMKKINKTLKEKILAIFTAEEKFERLLVPELAFEIEYAGVGEPVNKVIVDAQGNETLQPVGQGEFVTEAGIIVVDEQSNLVEIRDLPAQPAVEEPEVSETSGSTSGQTSGQTSTSGSTDQPIVATVDSTEVPVVNEQPSAPEIPVPKTSGDTAVSGSTETQPPKVQGIQKSILEVVGTSDGEYTILVKVQGGVVIEATAASMVDLMLAKQQEIDSLKLAKEALELKMKEPITDPILSPVQKVLTQAEFSKLTPYQKIMYNKGLSY